MKLLLFVGAWFTRQLKALCTGDGSLGFPSFVCQCTGDILNISSQLFYGGLPARLWFRNHLLFCWFWWCTQVIEDFITRIHNTRSIVPDVWWVGWGWLFELNMINSQLKITVKSFVLTESFFLFQFTISGEHSCEHFLIIVTIRLIKSPNPDSSEWKEKNFPGRLIFRVQVKLLQLKQIVYHRHVFSSFTFPPALREMENANCDLRKRNDHKSGLWCIISCCRALTSSSTLRLLVEGILFENEESSQESRPAKSGSVLPRFPSICRIWFSHRLGRKSMISQRVSKSHLTF